MQKYDLVREEQNNLIIFFRGAAYLRGDSLNYSDIVFVSHMDLFRVCLIAKINKISKRPQKITIEKQKIFY